MHIALVITARCNAACSHCVTSCGPSRTDALGKADILRTMDEASTISAGEPLHFSITGGEPFLDFELLLEVVAYARRIGAWVSCMTNAYWARTDTVATGKLTALRDAGLISLGVSVSRFHERFVPLSRVRRVLKIGPRLGISMALKGAVTRIDLQPGESLDRWKQQLDADSVDIFPVFPYLRNGVTLPDADYYREPGLPDQRCPNAVICIEPNGRAVSCCGPGATSQFLKIGNIHDDALATINQRFRSSGVQTILREKGPIEFARRATQAGIGHLLRGAYAGPCDLCMHIGVDPHLRRVAQQVAAEVECGPRFEPTRSAPHESVDAMNTNSSFTAPEIDDVTSEFGSL